MGKHATKKTARTKKPKTKLGLPDLTSKEGREVVKRIVRRELKVKGLLAHPRKLARLNKLMSV